jgi:protein-S-isoprenylcysteine O-methyltransferase Ste14
VARALLPAAIFGVLLALALFLPAGRVAWPMAWAFIAFYAVYAVVGSLVVDRELIVERTRSQPDARPLDLVLAGFAFLLVLPVTAVVSGYDARFGWSPRLPTAVQALALAVFAAGYCFALWAARHNRFFSTVVRIQRERGHHVVDTGPYALVRHPGYAGSIPAHLALPIALGSLWALVPTIAGLAFLIARTAYEDRTLRDELPGYREYVQRVRWRLCPGVW